MKMIFPFDFVEKNYDWWAVKRIYEEGGAPVQERYEKGLAIYEACIRAGFDPALDVYDFIVLTAVVKAGIAFENNRGSFINIEEDKKSGKIISLHIPEVGITDYYIEDRKPEDDNFPDARLTPEQWRDLVLFLNPLIQEQVIHLGILGNARENCESLIEKILIEAGFSEVYFTGQDL
jgi:hypothetical protein